MTARVRSTPRVGPIHGPTRGHRANGGATAIDNLALLCSAHHHLVHEGGFGLAVTSDGTLRFSRPNGSEVATTPISVHNPAESIESRHAALGLDITAQTGASLGNGERFDLAMTIDNLASFWPAEQAASSN